MKLMKCSLSDKNLELGNLGQNSYEDIFGISVNLICFGSNASTTLYKSLSEVNWLYGIIYTLFYMNLGVRVDI